MKPETLSVHAGRHPHDNNGAVNPPIYQTSTILFPTLQAFHAAEQGKQHYARPTQAKNDPGYGITGTNTTFALAEAMAALEGGDASLIFPSGLAAITTVILAFAGVGDHVLIVDSVYGPTRRFCNKELKRFGIEITYYDPLIGADITSLIKDNTTLILTESPGSITFEIQNIPAISTAAKAKKPDIVIAMDNSWATPIYLQPLALGVDVSILAATKYINGCSDILMGIVTAKEPYISDIFKTYRHLGMSSSPQECYLAQRGLRSMPTRLKQHQESAIAVATWLEKRKEVRRVIYPALPSHPQHELWKRDFRGACGLFSFILHPVAYDSLCNMINGLELYGIGASWGGYESLMIDFNLNTVRTATKWQEEGQGVRVHIGLENPEDLIRDLEKGLKRL